MTSALYATKFRPDSEKEGLEEDREWPGLRAIKSPQPWKG